MNLKLNSESYDYNKYHKRKVGKGEKKSKNATKNVENKQIRLYWLKYKSSPKSNTYMPVCFFM